MVPVTFSAQVKRQRPSAGPWCRNPATSALHSREVAHSSSGLSAVVSAPGRMAGCRSGRAITQSGVNCSRKRSASCHSPVRGRRARARGDDSAPPKSRAVLAAVSTQKKRKKKQKKKKKKKKKGRKKKSFVLSPGITIHATPGAVFHEASPPWASAITPLFGPDAWPRYIVQPA